MALEKILAEECPNPDALRISIGRDLLTEEGWIEYLTPESARNSPLASRMLHFKFIRRVFISRTFFTITRDPEYDWEHIIMDIREAIDRFLDSGLPVTEDKLHPEIALVPEHEEIVSVLKGTIREATSADGGALTFVSLHDGVLTVRPRGACFSCPYIQETIKKGLEPAFQKHFGFIHTVQAEE